jgi:MFS family permease
MAPQHDGAMSTAGPRRLALIALLISAWLLDLGVALVVPIAGAAATATLGPPDTGGGASDFVAFGMGLAGLSITSATIGLYVTYRRPRNPIGVLMYLGALFVVNGFAAFAMAVLWAATQGPTDPIAGAAAAWGQLTLVPGLFMSVPAVAMLFPNGSLPGRRWRWPFWLIVAAIALAAVLGLVSPWASGSGVPPNPFALPGIPVAVADFSGGLGSVGLIASMILATLALAVRFRRSRSVERAQIKWLLAALAVSAVMLPLSWTTDIGPDGGGLVDLLSVLTVTLIPISIGLAILRYRLFDIDRIVSRTISYALVTTLLIATFVLANLALQGLLSSFTASNSLAVAASTLLAAALFTPVRSRMHRAVDRRFDRARYDADRTVAAFSDRLSNQVDLPTLAAELDGTVRGAIAPSSVGLWLRGGER